MTKSHTFNTLSSPPVSKNVPLGLTSIAHTGPRWMDRTSRANAPVRASHRTTRQSLVVATNDTPSGENCSCVMMGASASSSSSSPPPPPPPPFPNEAALPPLLDTGAKPRYRRSAAALAVRGFMAPDVRTPGPVNVATRPVADSGKDSADGSILPAVNRRGLRGYAGNVSRRSGLNDVGSTSSTNGCVAADDDATGDGAPRYRAGGGDVLRESLRGGCCGENATASSWPSPLMANVAPASAAVAGKSPDSILRGVNDPVASYMHTYPSPATEYRKSPPGEKHRDRTAPRCWRYSSNKLVDGMSNTRTQPFSNPHTSRCSVGWYSTLRDSSPGAVNSYSWSPLAAFHTRMVPSTDTVAISAVAPSPSPLPSPPLLLLLPLRTASASTSPVWDRSNALYAWDAMSKTPMLPEDVPTEIFKPSGDTAHDDTPPSCWASRKKSEKSKGHTRRYESADAVTQNPSLMATE